VNQIFAQLSPLSNRQGVVRPGTLSPLPRADGLRETGEQAVAFGTTLVEDSFDADQLRAMGIAFDHACQSLGLRHATDRLTDIVALKIIEAARAGESDPARLYEAVMHWTSAA